MHDNLQVLKNFDSQNTSSARLESRLIVQTIVRDEGEG